MRKQRVLVIIDDLDRLTPKEALQVISIVGRPGDLPNTIYLLSYDEPRLTELVGRALKVDGDDFLEKIVQYIVQYKAHLPPLNDEDLVEMLNVDLTDLLGPLTDDERQRLDLVWYQTLRAYISDPRAVRRFVNSLSVSLPALAEFTDKIDLLVVEAMRIFEPRVYAGNSQQS